MKKLCQLAITLFLLVSAAAMAEQNDLQMTVTGKQEPILALMKKAIDAEFSDAQAIPLNGRIGVWISFKTLITGRNGLGVSLSPLVKNDEAEPSAFRLEFAIQSERLDGTRYIRSLMDQIEKQIAEQKEVTIVADPTPYRTMFQQSAECFKRLETDTELAEIAAKVSLAKPEAPSLAVLADESRPTPNEKKLIALWAEKRDTCFAPRKNVMAFYPGDSKNSVIMEFAEKSSQLIMDLYKGHISYGDFTGKRKAVLLAQKQRINELNANK